MIDIKGHKQKDHIDTWVFVILKGRKFPDQYWARILKRKPFSESHVEKLISFLNHTKELYSSLGAVLLHQGHLVTDDATMSQSALISFGIML